VLNTEFFPPRLIVNASLILHDHQLFKVVFSRAGIYFTLSSLLTESMIYIMINKLGNVIKDQGNYNSTEPEIMESRGMKDELQ